MFTMWCWWFVGGTHFCIFALKLTKSVNFAFPWLLRPDVHRVCLHCLWDRGLGFFGHHWSAFKDRATNKGGYQQHWEIKFATSILKRWIQNLHAWQFASFWQFLKRSCARISFTSTFFEESFVHVLIGTLPNGLCAEFGNKCGSPCHGRCQKQLLRISKCGTPSWWNKWGELVFEDQTNEECLFGRARNGLVGT